MLLIQRAITVARTGMTGHSPLSHPAVTRFRGGERDGAATWYVHINEKSEEVVSIDY